MYYNGCCVAPGGYREQRLQKTWKAQRGRHEACLLIVHESVNKGVMSKEVEIFFP